MTDAILTAIGYVCCAWLVISAWLTMATAAALCVGAGWSLIASIERQDRDTAVR